MYNNPNNTGLILSGWTVLLMPNSYTDYGEIARRIVRHGFAAHFSDFAKWAGDPGPAPDATTIYFSKDSRIMWVTQEMLDAINRHVFAGTKLKMPHLNDRWSSQNMYPAPKYGEDEGVDVFTLV